MKLVWIAGASLALVGVVQVTRTDGDRHLQVVGGSTTVTLLPSVVESSRIKLDLDASAEGDQNTAEPTAGFKIATANLEFTLTDGALSKISEGGIHHSGGFRLSSGANVVDARGFTIRRDPSANDRLQFVVGKDRGAFVAFELEHPRSTFNTNTQQLIVSQMDLLISDAAAQRLRRPELSGQLIGTLSIYGDAEATDGKGKVHIEERVIPRGGEDAEIDVALSGMQSLASAGRMGTFPNGVNGLTMTTTSCNVGTTDIPWFKPMDTRHPVIALNLYRLKDGKFEQIGWSWLKHGFLSTNSGGCGTCQHPGTGTLLGPGCSDTYGNGNNSDRLYLGGRDEVNAFTGVWNCTGSWFSNYQPDCIRRNTGSGLDPVAHRLEVLDSDLNVSGATFYYEAYYINANDFDRYNNVGSRTAVPNWNGSSWSFNTNTAMVQGPAINRWGEKRSVGLPNNEGDIIVAVQTTDLGNGMWQYEYAVYNHDSDRQMREFSIPVPDTATVQNVGFKDIDQDNGNQWTSTRSNGSITWSTGVHGSSTANPLKYSSLFNFRFQTNVPPTDGDASLGLFKPGTGTELTASTKVPVALQSLTSYEVINGSQFSGNLQSLAESDDDRLQVGPETYGHRAGSGFIGTLTAPAGASTEIVIGIESMNTIRDNVDPVQRVYLWNWNTSAWDLADSRPTTETDTLATISISSDVGRFIHPSTREVRMRVTHDTSIIIVNSRWRVFFDYVGVQFR